MNSAQEKSFRLCVLITLCLMLTVLSCSDDAEGPTQSGSNQVLLLEAELEYFGVVLNWTGLDRDYCAGYLLQRSSTPGGEFETIDTIGTYNNVRIDKNLVAGATFCYRLVALDYSKRQGICSNVDTVDIAGSCMCLSDTICLLSAVGGESIPVYVLNSSFPASFPWTVSENVDWLSPTTSSGLAPNGFRVAAEVNSTASNRMGTVIVSADEILDSPETLLVAQAAVGGILCPTATELVVPPLGGTNCEIDIVSCGGIPSCRWIAASDADWLSVRIDTGRTPASLILVADVNSSGAERSCQVTISPEGFVEQPDTVTVFQGRPFDPPVDYVPAGQPSSICCADFDGDGDVDLAVALIDQSNISVFKGNGDGTFAGGETYVSGDSLKWLRPADLDNDGDIDLAAVYADGLKVSVFDNAGDASFTATELSFTENFARVTPVDCDSDGDMDLVSANRTTNEIVIMVNGGAGSFSQVVRKKVGSRPEAVCAANFNLTGNIDLATANSVGDNVSLLINSSGLTYNSAVNFAAQDNPLALCGGDFNGDGRFDIAVACSGVNRIYLMRNTGATGSSRFTSGGVIEVVDQPVSICSADLDDDGDLDAAVSGYGLSIAANQGSGIFASALNFGSGSDFMSDVCAGDFDGDGDVDIAVVNQTASVVTVYINNCR